MKANRHSLKFLLGSPECPCLLRTTSATLRVCPKVKTDHGGRNVRKQRHRLIGWRDWVGRLILSPVVLAYSKYKWRLHTCQEHFQVPLGSKLSYCPHRLFKQLLLVFLLLPGSYFLQLCCIPFLFLNLPRCVLWSSILHALLLPYYMLC